MTHDNLWLDAAKETVAGYRRMIDATIAQLSDDQFFLRPHEDFNSVAVLLRHLGGNLQSRWTNFFTEDGEKSSRDRDAEFQDWTGSRDALLAYFDAGWTAFCHTLDSFSPDDCSRTVVIRGEPHSVPQALLRAMTHVSYHVGQLLLVARMVHCDPSSWDWLTIRPHGSEEHNTRTWGTASSRSVMGDQDRRG